MFKFFRGCPNLEHLDSTSLTISTDCGANHLEEEPLPKLLTAKVSYSSHILFPLLSNAQFLTARMVIHYSLRSLLSIVFDHCTCANAQLWSKATLKATESIFFLFLFLIYKSSVGELLTLSLFSCK
jgi:hypothetical protein